MFFQKIIILLKDSVFDLFWSKGWPLSKLLVLAVMIILMVVLINRIKTKKKREKARKMAASLSERKHWGWT